MQHCPSLLVSLLVSLIITFSAHAEIEFTGILTSGAKSSFALADTDTTSTRWLALGQSFSGWKITAYDAAKDSLTLSKDSVTKTLKLKGSFIQEAKTTAPLTISGDVSIKVGGSTLSGLVTLTNGMTQEISLPDGITAQISPNLQPDGNILYKASFKRLATDGNSSEVLSNPSVLSKPDQAFNMSVGEISFGFNPKSAVDSKH